MNTIRTKLALFFTLFSVLLVLAGILMNILFLEPFYIYRNEHLLSETAARILDKYRQDEMSIGPFIEALDRADGINIVITDGSGRLLHDSLPRNPGSDVTRLPSEIESLLSAGSIPNPGDSLYRVVSEPADQPAKLVYAEKLDRGGFIILRKSMKGVQESVAIANGFYLYAGLVIVLLGGLFTYVLSRRITRPVVEMSQTAEAIANLDFSRRVTPGSRDELGTLADSINRMSEKLSATLDALRQDVARRKALVRNISHELKSPIGVIKGYAEGLVHGVADDPDKVLRYCGVIADECDRMDAMVRELLNLSMLESGMFHVEPAPFDVGDLMRSVANRFEPNLRERGIDLRLRCPEHLQMTADPELIGQVVGNYLSNAIRHATGEFLVRMEADGFLRADGLPMCRIAVTNTGHPIPAEEFAGIWDVFYKVDRARSRKDGGHGLGLSIVREIVTLHGGTVGAQNTADGVVFFVEIPLNHFT